MTYLRFPNAHHLRIRTTNRLERLNGESRRRTKVIPRFPTERSCLTSCVQLARQVRRRPLREGTGRMHDASLFYRKIGDLTSI